MRGTRHVTYGALALLLAGCGTALPDSQAVPERSASASVEGAAQQAQRLWERTRPSAYEFTVDVMCFCPTYGRWRITVDGQDVVDAEPLDDQRGRRPELPTIDEILDEAVRAETTPGPTVEARYDPRTGVPRSVSIDWIKNAVDDEIAWGVSDFAPV